VRVFHPTYKDRQGRQREASRYYAEVTLHDRRVVRIAGFTSERATQELGRKVEEIVALKSVSAPMNGALRQWVDGLPGDIRNRLAEVGVLDANAATSKNLSAHVADYAAHLRAKENTETHVRKVVAHIERVAAFSGWRFLGDVKPEGFETWRTTERERGLSARTVNAVLISCKSFLAWAVKHGRAMSNPLAIVGKLNEQVDVRHERRALSHDEIVRLLDAAGTGADYYGMTGADRRALYALAVTTGARWSEIKSLTVADANVTTEPYTVTTRARYPGNKAARTDTLPLRADVADLLRPYLANKAPAAPLLPMPKSGQGAKIVKRDLQAAGLLYRDDAGRVMDFHALRHTFISGLARAGVHPKLAMDMARHSDINLTLKHYSHTVLGDRAVAADSLPDFLPEREAARATGTDNIPVGGISVLASCLPESGQKGGYGSQDLTTSGRLGEKGGSGVEGREMGISGHSAERKAGGPRWIRTTNQGIMSPLLRR